MPLSKNSIYSKKKNFFLICKGFIAEQDYSNLNMGTDWTVSLIDEDIKRKEVRNNRDWNEDIPGDFNLFTGKIEVVVILDWTDSRELVTGEKEMNGLQYPFYTYHERKTSCLQNNWQWAGVRLFMLSFTKRKAPVLTAATWKIESRTYLQPPLE